MKEYGTEEQRVASFNQAGKIANALNILGVAVAGWSVFYPKPYAYAIVAPIIMPVIALVVMITFRGLVRINYRRGSGFPSVTYAMFFPAMALVYHAVIDFSIFDYSKIWIPAVVIGVAYIAIASGLSREFSFKSGMDYLNVLGLTLVTFAYGYGVVVTTNCLFDRSQPQVYQASVQDKHMTSGKSTTYYLQLSPWGERKEARDVAVSKDVFVRANVNDDVNVYFMKGGFGIPWYEVNTITKITP